MKEILDHKGEQWDLEKVIREYEEIQDLEKTMKRWRPPMLQSDILNLHLYLGLRAPFFFGCRSPLRS